MNKWFSADLIEMFNETKEIKLSNKEAILVYDTFYTEDKLLKKKLIIEDIIQDTFSSKLNITIVLINNSIKITIQ